MSKISETIEALRNAIAYLEEYAAILDLNNCNNCGNRNCSYRPTCGERVRFNCPLYELPPIQTKRGKWKYNSKNGTFKIYTCDECGWNSEAEFNFCPNCGAKMEVSHER